MQQRESKLRQPARNSLVTHQDKFKLFFGNNPQLLKAIEQAATIREIPSKTMILSQDDTSDDIFYLMKGAAYAALVSPEGHEIWLDNFSEGTLFGEMVAFGLKERSATIFSSTTGSTLILNFSCSRISSFKNLKSFLSSDRSSSFSNSKRLSSL